MTAGQDVVRKNAVISDKGFQMVERKCPLCSELVQTHMTSTRPPILYTCSQCGVGLWLSTCSLGYRLTVAQSGVRV